LTHKLVVGDLHSRGVCDIDRNVKRGAGFERRACTTTLGNEQQFSEEQHAELKSSLSKLTKRNTLQALPEFVHDLEGLGIECRRLRASNFSQVRRPVLRHDNSANGSPVLRHDNSAKGRPPTVLNEEKTKWMDEASNLNINTQRLMSMPASRGVPLGKLPKHAQSKSLMRLVAEAAGEKRDADSQAETCSTCDEDPADEIPCRLPRFEIPKLDLREVRASSDVSTCAAGSDSAGSPPSSPYCYEARSLLSPTSPSSESKKFFADILRRHVTVLQRIDAHLRDCDARNV
jgi:hypothetical protein